MAICIWYVLAQHFAERAWGMGEPGCTRRTHPRPLRTQAPAPGRKILLWRGDFRAIPRPLGPFIPSQPSFGTNVLSGLNGYVTKDDTN